MHVMKMSLHLQAQISIKLVKFLKFSMKVKEVKDLDRFFINPLLYHCNLSFYF